jgi:hypothetical protein
VWRDSMEGKILTSSGLLSGRRYRLLPVCDIKARDDTTLSFRLKGEILRVTER